jgi:hypothetical protein
MTDKGRVPDTDNHVTKDALGKSQSFGENICFENFIFVKIYIIKNDYTKV